MFFSILPGCSNNGHRHMHSCSIYKEWKRFREHNTKEVKWCKKTMFTSEKHGDQVTSAQISYIQMVREIVVRVLDFSQCENLKRGQENRGLLFSISPRVRVVRVVRVLDLAHDTVQLPYIIFTFFTEYARDICRTLFTMTRPEMDAIRERYSTAAPKPLTAQFKDCCSKAEAVEKYKQRSFIEVTLHPSGNTSTFTAT